jgi:hypothetical protein
MLVKAFLVHEVEYTLEIELCAVKLTAARSSNARQLEQA